MVRQPESRPIATLGVRLDGATRVCHRADGKPFNPLSLTQAFLAFMRKQPDLPRVRFHDLRHTHATALLAAGAHPKVVQERLGHSSVALTLDLYSHTVYAG
ncbi:MAG: tyrosine-type recombinase/integrase [Thiohalocapsa sp.]